MAALVAVWFCTTGMFFRPMSLLTSWRMIAAIAFVDSRRRFLLPSMEYYQLANLSFINCEYGANRALGVECLSSFLALPTSYVAPNSSC